MRLPGRNGFSPTIYIKAICFCYAALQFGEKMKEKKVKKVKKSKDTGKKVIISILLKLLQLELFTNDLTQEGEKWIPSYSRFFWYFWPKFIVSF